MNIQKKMIRDIEKTDTKPAFTTPTRKTKIGAKIENCQKLSQRGRGGGQRESEMWLSQL